jgi:hypothetical protein
MSVTCFGTRGAWEYYFSRSQFGRMQGTKAEKHSFVVDCLPFGREFVPNLRQPLRAAFLLPFRWQLQSD